MLRSSVYAQSDLVVHLPRYPQALALRNSMTLQAIALFKILIPDSLFPDWDLVSASFEYPRWQVSDLLWPPMN